MFFVMMIAGMVCTALSVSGQTITDLKTGYWLGSTPWRQERMKFIGVAASAVAAALTIAVLAKVFYFAEAPAGGASRTILEAPQAAIMKELVHSFMSREPVAVILFGAGAMVTIVMEMLGVPALIFALGMYLPLYLNSPALVGGFLAHFLDRRANGVGGARGRSIRERGIVIASGLMAGGALGGVFGAILHLVPGYREDWIPSPIYAHDAAAQLVSLGGFIAFVAYVWFVAQRTRTSD
jgi:putative OPT family oligopeptide transporter